MLLILIQEVLGLEFHQENICAEVFVVFLNLFNKILLQDLRNNTAVPSKFLPIHLS
jgi:hypothetical protein